MASYTFTNAVITETGFSGSDIVWDQVTITITDGDTDNFLDRDSADPGGDQTFTISAFNEVKANSNDEPDLNFTYTSIDRGNRGIATLVDANGATIRGFWFEIENGFDDFRVFLPIDPNAGFDYTQNGNGAMQNVQTGDYSYGNIQSVGDDQFVVSDASTTDGKNWLLDGGNDLAQSAAGADFINLGADDDTAFGGAGNDTIQGGDVDDSLVGEAGDDNLAGGDGADTLKGGAGADTLSGGAGADSLDGGAGNDSIDGGAGNDTIAGGAGADSVTAGDGDDIVAGGAGNDTIQGGAGADTIIGDGGTQPPTLTRQSFEWDQIPDPNGGDPIDDGDNLAGGTTQNTGLVNVTMSYTDQEGGSEFAYENGTQLTTGINTGGEGISANSGAVLRGFDDGDTGVVRFDFTSAAAGVADEVRNLSFRVNDIDSSSFRDVISIRAFDAAGNLVDVRLSGGENITLTDTDGVAGADSAAGLGNASATDASASILITIEGPVARLEIDYNSVGNALHAVNITDIYFDAVTPSTAPTTGNDSIDGGDGDDKISGGAGADILVGGAGDDEITGGAGSDLLVGGTGSDTFFLQGGEGADNIVGGENPGDFDRIILSNGNFRVNYTNNDRTTESGVIQEFDDDGNLIRQTAFSEIEQVVCFTAGVMIHTPEGEKPIETLRPGDLVVTLDHGPQPIRWIGRRRLGRAELAMLPKLRPIRIRAGALGDGAPKRDLILSPQHRVLLRSRIARRMFGVGEALTAAKNLLGLPGVAVEEEAQEVDYIHILLDRHEVVTADGALTETLLIGPEAWKSLSAEAREEIGALFPAICEEIGARPSAREIAPGARTRGFVERSVKNRKPVCAAL